MTTLPDPAGNDGKADASDFAFAQMLHNGVLATWLVQTAGKAAAALLVPSFIGAFVAGLSEEPVFIGVGSLVGVLLFLVYLTSTHAPLPDARTISYLEDDVVDERSES